MHACQSGLRVLPMFDCGADASQGQCRAQQRGPVALGEGGEVEFITTVDFTWGESDGTFRNIQPGQIQLKLALTGEDPNTVERSIFLSQPPAIRCDKKMAVNGSDGCVFPDAAAVYLLRLADGSIREAAQHIVEAQAAGSPGGGFTIRQGTRALVGASGAPLRRAKSEAIQGINRAASCRAADSLFNTRLPQNQSASCAANQQTCSCDEYPFASTWDGGSFAPNQTSVKRINESHNNRAGGGKLSTGFYARERVLDFTNYTGDPFSPYDPALESNRGGDDFWVLVK